METVKERFDAEFSPLAAMQRRLLELEREHLRLVERVRQLEEEKRDV